MCAIYNPMLFTNGDGVYKIIQWVFWSCNNHKSAHKLTENGTNQAERFLIRIYRYKPGTISQIKGYLYIMRHLLLEISNDICY